MLSVAFFYFAECHYAECRSAECRDAKSFALPKLFQFDTYLDRLSFVNGNWFNKIYPDELSFLSWNSFDKTIYIE